MEDNWIRVEDGLPEDEETVIVNCPDNKDLESTDVVEFGYYNYLFDCWYLKDKRNKYNVTHWMKKPVSPTK